MKYFTYIGIAITIATEFAKAMADGRIEKGEWVDAIFAIADRSAESLVGFDLDPFRPIAEEVKNALNSGEVSVLGFLRVLVASLDRKGIDYQFRIPVE